VSEFSTASWLPVLLTEGGIRGAKVVGATGFNNRTGEFMIFKSKAAVLATAGIFYMWMLDTEHAGCRQFPFPLCDGRRISHGMESRRGACFDGADNTADAGHGL